MIKKTLQPIPEMGIGHFEFGRELRYCTAMRAAPCEGPGFPKGAVNEKMLLTYRPSNFLLAVISKRGGETRYFPLQRVRQRTLGQQTLRPTRKPKNRRATTLRRTPSVRTDDLPFDCAAVMAALLSIFRIEKNAATEARPLENRFATLGRTAEALMA
jgi:hypothetical protein